MRTGEALFFIRNGRQVLLWCRGKEPLILDEPNARIQDKEICCHHDKRRNYCDYHFLLPSHMNLIPDFSGHHTVH